MRHPSPSTVLGVVAGFWLIVRVLTPAEGGPTEHLPRRRRRDFARLLTFVAAWLATGFVAFQAFARFGLGLPRPLAWLVGGLIAWGATGLVACHRLESRQARIDRKAAELAAAARDGATAPSPDS